MPRVAVPRGDVPRGDVRRGGVLLRGVVPRAVVFRAAVSCAAVPRARVCEGGNGSLSVPKLRHYLCLSTRDPGKDAATLLPNVFCRPARRPKQQQQQQL